MVEDYEIRKVQAYSGERSLTFVLPKIYSEKLGIEKGDFLKVHIEDGKLVVQKADVWLSHGGAKRSK
jgi:bifunctional DNA-binding transcriptional regulator/antitoxin component of YhaV-PrlF toxin-antitoxin module